MSERARKPRQKASPGMGLDAIAEGSAASAQAQEVVTLDLDGEVFAVDALLVREILDLVPVTTVPNSLDFVGALINVRGKVVPVADLRVIFGMARRAPTLDTRIIVLETMIEGDPTAVGILADKVHEVTVIETADVEETPRIGMRWDPRYIRCIGKRADDFIIVLDVEAILAEAIGEAGPIPNQSAA